MNEEFLKDKFENIDRRLNSHHDKIEKLENKFHENKINIEILCNQVEELCKKVDKLTDKIDLIMGKNGQKWDNATWVVITAIITAIVSFLLGKFGI